MVATNQIKNLEHHTFSWVEKPRGQSLISPSVFASLRETQSLHRLATGGYGSS